MVKKPCLATDVDLSKLRYPVIAMPKIDGVRQLWLQSQPSATGRSLKVFPNLHLQKLFTDRSKYLCADGELVITGMETAPDVCRKTQSATTTIQGQPDLTWWLFDLALKGLPYKERLRLLHAQQPPVNCRLVPYVYIENEEELLDYHSRNIVAGYEGTIVRDPEGMYKEGRTTVNEGSYLRIKDFADAEAVVVRLVEAMENLNPAEENELGYTQRSSHQANKVGKGMVGSFICYSEQFGEFAVSAGEMDHVQRTYYWVNQCEIIGKTITYKYFPHGVKEKPRFPVFKTIRGATDM